MCRSFALKKNQQHMNSMAIITQPTFFTPPLRLPWSSLPPLSKPNSCTSPISSSLSSFPYHIHTSPSSWKLIRRRPSAINPSSLNVAETYQEEEEGEGDDDFVQVVESGGDDHDLQNGHGNGSLFSYRKNERSVIQDEEGNNDSKTVDYSDRFKLQHGREVFQERAYLVGIERKGQASSFGIADSLAELAQLADTAGLKTVGSTYQKLDQPNPKTYIGSGKVSELCSEVRALDIEIVIFDDELSPGQLRSLEKALGNEVRVCDRTALILDIFSQRAATREATLQVQLAQTEYQLPRLTRMWTHLERQAGGMVKGMGEKQIEVDKRILRTRMALLKKDLDSVRGHRQQYRDRRGSVPIPVVSLVGYTNAGKSTLLNRLSGADVLAEDRLFATLDPTTRKVELSNGTECLMTDTVGFIQKLPTQLVASFRATLEEINDSSLLLHIVDISHPLAKEQMEAVESVLAELNVKHIPRLTVWNKIDRADRESIMQAEAVAEGDILRISAVTGEGVDDLCKAIQEKLKETLVWVDVLVPYDKGEFVNVVHRLGVVDSMKYLEDGISLKAHVPLRISRQLHNLRQTV